MNRVACTRRIRSLQDKDPAQWQECICAMMPRERRELYHDVSLGAILSLFEGGVRPGREDDRFDSCLRGRINTFVRFYRRGRGDEAANEGVSLEGGRRRQSLRPLLGLSRLEAPWNGSTRGFERRVSPTVTCFSHLRGDSKRAQRIAVRLEHGIVENAQHVIVVSDRPPPCDSSTDSPRLRAVQWFARPQPKPAQTPSTSSLAPESRRYRRPRRLR